MIPLRTLLRVGATYLPTRSRYGVARRLVLRANSERDAKRWSAASALYEEALRLSPGDPRVHVQCGHMHKEAGNYTSAGYHYHAALDLVPDDPDLALQLGHFYKISGKGSEAAAEYARALKLRPGWLDAANELARLRELDIGDYDLSDSYLDKLAPELLPRTISAQDAIAHDTIQVRRLGATRVRVRGGFQRVLRGVEAIRGVCISSTKLVEMQILIDDEIIYRTPLEPVPDWGNGRHCKYVFNIWLDFSAFVPGRRQAAVKFVDSWGKSRAHRSIVEILAPLPADRLPDSDAAIPPLDGTGSVEAQINGRPSMVRRADRQLLPSNPRAILVQRADQLGDLVCSVPAFQRLRAIFPEARIVALVTPANADLARTLPEIDEVVVVEWTQEDGESPRALTLFQQEKLRRTLEAYRFDIALDLGEGSESRPLLLLSGASFLYGFKDRESPWLSAGFDFNAHDPANYIEVTAPSRKLVALVDGLAALASNAGPPVRRPELNRGMLEPYGLRSDERFAVLHTGARLAYTRWPYFDTLAEMLIRRTDLTVIVIGHALPPIASHYPDRLRLAPGMLPFDVFDALMSFCDLFVGNDSGPKHLAALRGANVISLHMARLNWNEWGQERSGLIMSRRVPCAGCAIGGQAEDCGKEFACLRNISADEVFAAACNLLDPTLVREPAAPIAIN